MSQLLATWEPSHIIVLVAVCVVGVVLLVLVATAADQRSEQLKHELKRQMLDRGMSAADIERLLSRSEAVDELAGALGKTLVTIQANPAQAAALMSLFTAADYPVKCALVSVVQEMATAQEENEAFDAEQVLGAVRGLVTVEPPVRTTQALPELSLPEHRIVAS